MQPQQAPGGDADDRWVAAAYPREELLRAMVAGGMAGVVTHPMENVLWKIGLLVGGDSRSQFGLTGLDRFDRAEVLALVAEASGFVPDRHVRWGPVRVQAERILEACGEAGDRLAEACARGESVLFATGHPGGLIRLYQEMARLVGRRGATVLRPADGVSWQEPGLGLREVRYLEGVAVVQEHGEPVHTHGAGSMQRILEHATPDLVVADHGFAGAAIEAGIDTVSIADVNDPALLVAKALGRTRTVIVMDDNVDPDAYWPCLQAMASRLPR
jgi:hypothetical protein